MSEKVDGQIFVRMDGRGMNEFIDSHGWMDGWIDT